MKTELLNEFYHADTIHFDGKEYSITFNAVTFANQRLNTDIINPSRWELLLPRKERRSPKHWRKKLKV